jgi:hypothetical protein
MYTIMMQEKLFSKRDILVKVGLKENKIKLNGWEKERWLIVMLRVLGFDLLF